MPADARDYIITTLNAAMLDVQAERYMQARRRIRILGDAIYLLGDYDNSLWLAWSALHFSMGAVANTDEQYKIPQEVIQRMKVETERAGKLLMDSLKTGDTLGLFQASEQITASAGEMNYYAHYHCFLLKKEETDAN